MLEVSSFFLACGAEEELYDHFKLPQKYREVIEAVIKERK